MEKKNYDLEKAFLDKHLQLPGRKAKDGGKRRKSAGDGTGDSTQNKVIVITLDQSDDEFDPTAAPAVASRAAAAARPSAATGAGTAAATARKSTRSSRPALVGPPPFAGQRNDSTHVNDEEIYEM